MLDLAPQADQPRHRFSIRKLHDLHAAAVDADAVRPAILEMAARMRVLPAGAGDGGGDGTLYDAVHGASLLLPPQEPTYAKLGSRLADQLEKVPHELFSVLAEHRLGMELHAVDRLFDMGHALNHAVVAARRDAQGARERIRRQAQRVVACELDAVGQAGEDSGRIVLDDYDGLVVGPGPGKPSDTPRVLAVLEAAIGRGMPVLGVCLGLQAIGEVMGATVTHAPRQMHGKTSVVEHDATGVFAGLPSRVEFTRYHSLCLAPDSLPGTLRVTARSDDGVIQGIAHTAKPVHGVQFHPESVLSEHGEELVRNFLALVG